MSEHGSTPHNQAMANGDDKVIDARSGTFGVRVKLPNPGLAIPSGVSCKAAFDGSAN